MLYWYCEKSMIHIHNFESHSDRMAFAFLTLGK